MLGNLTIIVFMLLGLWKLYDLLFKQKEPNWKGVALVIFQFMTEFIYKIERGAEKYESPPEEDAVRYMAEFRKWVETKKRNT